MAKSVTDAQVRESLRAYREHGSFIKAGKALKLPSTTIQYHVKTLAKQRNLTLPQDDLILPHLPSTDLSAEELIEQACSRYGRHEAAKEARKWMPIQVKGKKPIGVCFMGDPHVDNQGTNWPLLKRDITILEETEGLYAVNIGDLTDNWIGRLMRLYAASEMSKHQAWKLAKYVIKDAKIKWLCHILGNHDLWGDGAYVIKATAHPMVPVEEWQSRFRLIFDNGVSVRVYAAHDFPGNSMWNKMHGPQKTALIAEEADIYACGHKHEWGIVTNEHPQRNFVYHLIRARGYKHIDSFANQLGFGSQKHGASITAIIDPQTEGPNRIVCFADLREAADYLGYKRAKK